ncbi:hypothetical protein HPP92_014405 [Vanilla planifolia]|uniref:Uncharacterized protein n=1 Tax=Vanilla planifolia TaxID=51239 RepID=A0A835QPZ6_VANPL|nr:hypothetical protein HPP92_014405 [Vanilla planifolia]
MGANLHWLICLIFFFLAFLSSQATAEEVAASRKTYIVYIHSLPGEEVDTELGLGAILSQSSAGSSSSNGPPRIVYSYRNVLNGWFAAQLTDTEVTALKSYSRSFVHVIPDFIVPLATTRTPQFLGLTSSPQNAAEGGLWNESSFGRGVIVGLLDTGILPNHPSFNDDGMPPPPAKWKGKCEFDKTTDCNNKLIGARSLLIGLKAMKKDQLVVEELETPLDTIGHGTHTASTAVGRFVGNASALGNAAGTAVGMAPEAHLAVYKICTLFGCVGSDILAGLDAAVGDGADVLSLSLGGASISFDVDPIAIGTFAAIEKGIFVSLAAGNRGPFDSSLSNEAPWMLTVGAATMDRVIQTTVKLGNGEEYEGKSLYQTSSGDPDTRSLPLIFPGATGNYTTQYCFNHSLNDVDVKGKIVVCNRGGGMARVQQGAVVKSAGGAGMILAASQDDGYTTLADAHVLPASHVSFADATKIKAYIKSTSSPTAAIIPRGTLIGHGFPAPMMAAFSSRGPSQQSRGVLKPDIIGPGVDVLAGWPSLPIGPSNDPAFFNVISGTSMSTPHLSGIAALLRGVHPTWSPAIIRSAIITTADNSNTAGKPITDEKLNEANLFAKGAGLVNPTKAASPGFVYDIQPDDYIAYLCGLNYSNTQVSAVARRPVNCSSIQPIFDVELNYPSFSVEMPPSFSRKVNRTATSVEAGGSTYEVEIVAPAGIAVAVSPETLSFSEAGQYLSYTVEFSRDGSNSTAQYAEGYLCWVSSTDKHIKVRSPISITFVTSGLIHGR